MPAMCALQLPPKRPIEQRLEQVLRLALLDAQPLEFVDDVAWAMRLIYGFLFIHLDSLLRKT